MRSLTRSVSGCALAAMACAPALAQEQSQEHEMPTLSSITVTATKRGLDAMDIAGQTDAVMAEALAPRGLRNVNQLDRAFADVHIRQRSNQAYANFTIRGQSSPDFYNPAAQLYIDGLPQDYALFSQSLPQGVEQVEILYGPQGTLYGRGAVGGVINIATRRPDGTLRLDATTDLWSRGRGAQVLLNAPLAENTLFADIALDTSKERGDLHELGTGMRRGDSEDVNGRLRLRYAPIGNPLEVMFTTARNTRRSDEEYFIVNGDLPARRVLPAPSNYRLKTSSHGLYVHYDMGTGVLSSLSGFQDRDFDRTVFSSYTPEAQRTVTQEFRWASKPGADKPFDFVTGVYFQDLDFTRNVPAAGLVSNQNIRSLAAYGETTWHVSKRIDVTPGLRLEQERARVDTQLGKLELNRNKTFSATSPKLGITYRFSRDAMLYGLYSTGYKAGGFTRAVTPQNIDFSYAPQKARNIEFGFKTTVLDNTLQLGGALYFMDIKDYQLSVGPITGQYLQNVGDARTRGASLSTEWQITRRLHAKAGMAFNDSKFKNYRDPTGSTSDRSGNNLPYAPQSTANLTAEYQIPLSSGGRIVPRVGVSWVGRTYFDEANTIRQNGYALVDVGMSWQINRNVSADFYIHNVSNKTYAVYAFNASTFGFGNAYQAGNGRIAGVRLNVGL